MASDLFTCVPVALINYRRNLQVLRNPLSSCGNIKHPCKNLSTFPLDRSEAMLVSIFHCRKMWEGFSWWSVGKFSHPAAKVAGPLAPGAKSPWGLRVSGSDIEIESKWQNRRCTIRAVFILLISRSKPGREYIKREWPAFPDAVQSRPIPTANSFPTHKQ